MSNSEEGIVISVEGAFAQVRMMRHGDCKSCGACPGDDATVTRIQNTMAAEPGQRVAVEMKPSGMLRAAFMVYILPLAAIGAGVLGGRLLASAAHLPLLTCEVSESLLFLALALVIIKRFDRQMAGDSARLPKTVRILS